MSSYSANEFVVALRVSSTSSSLAPSLEFFCLQAPACSYLASTRANCDLAQFADYTELQANRGRLGSGCNRVELADASALYGGAACTDCSGVLIRVNDGRNWFGRCPIGTVLVMTARGTASTSQRYSFEHDPRLKVVNDELPAGCLVVRNLIDCPSGQVTIRFTQSEEANYCDASDESTPCPFPVSGFPFGTCAASQPCPVARDLLEENELN